jgi:transposase
MATARPDDELWKPIEPLLPVRKRRFHYPGRKRIDDHRTLAGTLFVLPTGIAWQQLPQEPGYGSGMTCWRRLQERQQAGVLQAPDERLLSQLRVARRLDLSRAVCDSASLRALFWGRSNRTQSG